MVNNGQFFKSQLVFEILLEFFLSYFPSKYAKYKKKDSEGTLQTYYALKKSTNLDTKYYKRKFCRLGSRIFLTKPLKFRSVIAPYI